MTKIGEIKTYGDIARITCEYVSRDVRSVSSAIKFILNAAELPGFEFVKMAFDNRKYTSGHFNYIEFGKIKDKNRFADFFDKKSDTIKGTLSLIGVYDEHLFVLSVSIPLLTIKLTAHTLDEEIIEQLESLFIHSK